MDLLSHIGKNEELNYVLTDLEINRKNKEDFFLKYATPEGVHNAIMVSTSCTLCMNIKNMYV